MLRNPRPPRLKWRGRRDDAFPVSVFRRDGARVVHLAELHAHDFFTLLFVDGGCGSVKLVDRCIKLQPGDIHVLPPGEPHDTSGLGEVAGWVAEFTADALGEHAAFDRRLGQPLWMAFNKTHGKLSLPRETWARMGRWFVELDRELTERTPRFQDAARSILRLVLIEVTRQTLPIRSATLSPVVMEVLQLIDQRYTEVLSLAEVARSVGRSPSYVTFLLRSQTQLSVLEWIAARRLEEARRRLRESDEEVAIIAERVGYGSADHFIRQFRKAHGMTPGAWRKALLVVRPERVTRSIDPSILEM